MSKVIVVKFNDDGIEERVGAPDCYINIDEIVSFVELKEAWATRLTLRNGRSYLVDSAPDVLLHEIEKSRKPIDGDQRNGLPTNDFYRFRLIREEHRPQSWLGRVFSDAAHIIKGNKEDLPPLRVTHDVNGVRLSRDTLRKIYDADGNVNEAFIATQPHLAP